MTKGPANREKLSTAQEDYLETIYKISKEQDTVRITDIAERLGVRLPPVTRAVNNLEKLGLVERDERREIVLTPQASRLAQALVHRHADLFSFLTEVLGMAEGTVKIHLHRAVKKLQILLQPLWDENEI